MPVFTVEQLDSDIAATRAAINALLSGKEYTVDYNGNRRTVRREDLPELRAHLQFLISERQKLETGTTAAVGRTYAKQAGGGRW